FDFLEQASRLGTLPPVVVNTAGELTAEENLRLRAYTDSTVVKGVRSRERLLDEITLFLHSIRRPEAGAVPAAAAPPGAPAAPAPAPGIGADKELAGKTVLIVDD